MEEECHVMGWDVMTGGWLLVKWRWEGGINGVKRGGGWLCGWL